MTDPLENNSRAKSQERQILVSCTRSTIGLARALLPLALSSTSAATCYHGSALNITTEPFETTSNHHAEHSLRCFAITYEDARALL